MPTLTGWERRIEEYASEHGLDLSRSKVQRIALRVDKRHRLYREFDFDAYMTITYADPVGEEACNRVTVDREMAEVR